MARLRMHVNFGRCSASRRIDANAHNQMAVSGIAVIAALLGVGQVPVRVKPMWIAGGEE